MSRYLCHDQPTLLSFEAKVIDARPGAVRLDRTAFHPGGGGQLSDRGLLRWQGGERKIVGIDNQGDQFWHLLDGGEAAALPHGAVAVDIDPDFRSRQASLHTGLHLLSALVYQGFAGALITGCQIADDGTARCDFDLPEVDNDKLRALEPELNALIARAIPVRTFYATAADFEAEPSLRRSAAVAPPPGDDGTVRIVEIEGFDRQGCGGTHLMNTGQSRPLRIAKIENKGRRNRRVRVALV